MLTSEIAPHPLTVIRLRGSQAQMGAQHGAILAELGGYESMVAFYPRMASKMLALSFGHGLRRVVEPTLREVLGFGARRLATARRARFPEYAARTDAMLAAGGLGRELGASFGVMDALQNAVGLLGRYGVLESTPLAGAALAACSSLAVWDGASSDGKLRHARNFDFPGAGVWDRAPAVVFCEPDDGLRYGFVTTRGGDIACVTGFNEAGITLGAHTRFHRDVSFDGVTIGDMAHEIVRRARTLDDAVRIARSLRSGSTWGILVSSAAERRAVLLEHTAERAAVVDPGEGADHLACTNRYRAPELRPGEVTSSHAFVVDSDARFARLERAVEDASGAGLSAADLERLLGDTCDPGAVDGERPARRLAGNCITSPITVHSVVAEPEEERLRISVGPAPTGLGPYTTLPWSWAGPVGAEEVETPSALLDEAARPLDPSARQAMRLYVAAARAHVQGADPEAVRALVGSAVALVPDEPNLRFLAGVLALRAGALDEGAHHLESALALDRGAHRRALALLWYARAQEARGARAAAAAARRELARIDHPDAEPSRNASERDRGRSITRRALATIVPDLLLIDATFLAHER